MLDNENSQRNDSKLVFNVKYYQVFRHVKYPLRELHVILACDKDHKKVFPEVPIIGFKNNENLKSRLVRAALPDINPTKVGDGRGKGGCSNAPLIIYFSSHKNSFYTSPDDPGLSIKLNWAHIIHAAKTFQDPDIE